MTGILAASYALRHGPAFVGMVADGQLNNIVSKVNTDVVNIAYGKAVFADGADGAKLPTAGSTAAQFDGVAVRELNRAYNVADVFGASVKKDFSVLTAGVIWVKAAEAVLVDDPAFARVGSTNNGDFAKSAGSAATLSVAIPNAKFLTAGNAGDLVKLSIVVGG